MFEKEPEEEHLHDGEDGIPTKAPLPPDEDYLVDDAMAREDLDFLSKLDSSDDTSQDDSNYSGDSGRHQNERKRKMAEQDKSPSYQSESDSKDIDGCSCSGDSLMDDIDSFIDDI